MLEDVPFGGSLVLLGDFNPHVGRRGMIGKNASQIQTSVLLLDFCALQIVHNKLYTGIKASMCALGAKTPFGNSSMIDSVVV